jgi:tetratricopeptide (TPR) repeat protein
MLRTLLFSVFILSSLSTIAQWKSFYPDNKPPKSQIKKDKSDNDLLFNTIYFNALKQKSLENYDQSLKVFQRCIKMKPNNIEVVYQASLISSFLGLSAEAILYSEQTVESKPKNIWYLRNHIENLLELPDYKLASEYLLKLVDLEPNNEVNFYQLADSYIYDKNYRKAISVYNRLEKIRGISKLTSMQKQKLYMQTKNFKMATNEIFKLSDKFPLDLEILEILAECYLLSDKRDLAFDIFKRIALLNPENGKIHLTLANYYRDKNNNNKSYDELRLAFSSSQLSLEVKISILASYFPLLTTNDTLKKQAYELCLIMINIHPLSPQVYAIYADLLFSDKKKNQAKELYKKTLKIDKNFKDVWTQLLFIDVEQNNFDSLLLYSFDALNLFPTDPLYYYFYAISNLRINQPIIAFKYLEIGIEYVYDNPPLLKEFQISLAESSNSLQEYSYSDSIYEKVLSVDPDNILVLNNFSYYLSLRKEKLEKAKTMSYKCNKLEPNNGTYQDTYAWVLFCLGEYVEARLWVEKAIKNGSDTSFVVLEHYGDILFKLNLKQEAIVQWKKAFSINEKSQSLMKKISNE